MATTAVVVGAAATAGAAAYSASQSGGGKGGSGSLPTASKYEKILNRGSADMLDQSRALASDALAQANFLTPELYRTLGFEPVFDGPDPSTIIAAAGQKFDAASQKINEINDQIRNAKGTLKGPARLRRLKELRRLRRFAMDDQKNAERELTDAQAMPRRVVGLKPLEEQGGVGGLERETLALQEQTLQRALRGEEPIDSTLRREYQEREKVLREKLRRQLGPDYETTTAGSDALNDFSREQNEAFEIFNRRTVETFSALTESRAAALSQLTDDRLRQLLTPSSQQLGRAGALSGLTEDRNAFVELQERIRTGQFNRKQVVDQQQAAAEAAQAQGISSAIGSLGGGLMGASGSLGALTSGPSKIEQLTTSANSVLNQSGLERNPNLARDLR